MNTPSPTLVNEAETYCIQSRANDRTRNNFSEESVTEINGAMSAAVANAQILNGTININPDFLCPISQLIPEDAILFGGTLYERSYAEQYIRKALTIRLPQGNRDPRYLKDLLNPSGIIYSCED